MTSRPVNVVNVRCRFRQPMPQLYDCGIRLGSLLSLITLLRRGGDACVERSPVGRAS